ncbi:MAG: dTDP-4-dehydrorhamnose 3,5-epimerase family protein [Candidatus Omnitrophica bacterium]|nr:dTDP-4-dehydrorhamnose 3,5-epimerase family protein [Candidatus Omnitrophota bacterium]
MIQGIEIKKLIAHQDERGFFCELIRTSDEFFKGQFGQLSHSMTHTGVFKAWHMHHKQTDWICAIAGDIKLGLYDMRKGSSTHGQLNEILMGQTHGRVVVKIPPGIAHGYKIIQGPAHIIYVMNREYDPSDEIRIPHDDATIGYDWTV